MNKEWEREDGRSGEEKENEKKDGTWVGNKSEVGLS